MQEQIVVFSHLARTQFSQMCQHIAHWSHCSDNVAIYNKQLVTGVIFINPCYCLNSKQTPPHCDWVLASDNCAVTSKWRKTAPAPPFHRLGHTTHFVTLAVQWSSFDKLLSELNELIYCTNDSLHIQCVNNQPPSPASCTTSNVTIY